ncbi:hypothetical protein PDJAM_G00233660, partial [Pangasius djambal]|nr:hypothetical protein [Pangasius djambal]
MCPLQVQLDFLNQRQAVATSNIQLLHFTYPILLRNDDVRERTRQSEELQRVLQAQRAVVLRVILHTVVDVGNFADVIAAILHAEVPLQLGPALEHELQSL